MRRYLLVDDNLQFAENLAEILSDDGAESTVVASGAQALEEARSTRFDAMVTDMRMPLMSGAKLVHEIRAIDPGLPAIVVSAYTGEDDLTAAREEGLLAVLPKPAPIARLRELLQGARRNALVAVVDDDPALADNLADALRDRGFSSVTAHSVGETMRLAEVKPFAALVDIRVKGGPDGEALRTLLRHIPALPVLAMTAFLETRDIVIPMPIFEKPFATAELLRAIEELHRARNPPLLS